MRLDIIEGRPFPDRLGGRFRPPVSEIAKRSKGPPDLLGLSRSNFKDIDCCWEAVNTRAIRAHSHLHRHLATRCTGRSRILTMDRDALSGSRLRHPCPATCATTIAMVVDGCAHPDEWEFLKAGHRRVSPFNSRHGRPRRSTSPTRWAIPELAEFRRPDPPPDRRRVDGADTVVSRPIATTHLGMCDRQFPLAAIKGGARGQDRMLTINGPWRTAGQHRAGRRW